MDVRCDPCPALPACQSYEPKITDLSSLQQSVALIHRLKEKDGWWMGAASAGIQKWALEGTQQTVNPWLGFERPGSKNACLAFHRLISTLLVLTLWSLSLSCPQTMRNIPNLHFFPLVRTHSLCWFSHNWPALTWLCWMILWRCGLYPPCGQWSIFWEGKLLVCARADQSHIYRPMEFPQDVLLLYTVVPLWKWFKCFCCF